MAGFGRSPRNRAAAVEIAAMAEIHALATPGPFLLPDMSRLIKVKAVQGKIRIELAKTDGGQMSLSLSSHCASALLALPSHPEPQESFPFALGVDPSETAEAAHLAVFSECLGYSAIRQQWLLLKFLNERDQRVCVPIYHRAFDRLREILGSPALKRKLSS